MGKEIEIKLMLEGDSLNETVDSQVVPGAIKELTSLKVLAEEKLDLINLYYDTPKQELYKHGIALRVRKTGESFEMTIKTRPQSRQSGLHVHPEYNIELSEQPQVPDLFRFPAEIFAGAEAEGLTRARLQESIFNNMGQSCKRHILLVSPGDELQLEGKVEIAIDDVLYQGVDGKVHGAEVELELKEGVPAILSFVLKEVLNAVGKVSNLHLRAGGMSKMQRAAIYAGISPVPDCDPQNITTEAEAWKSLSELEAALFMKDEPRDSEKLLAFAKSCRNILGGTNPISPSKVALINLALKIEPNATKSLTEQKELFRRELFKPEFVRARIDFALQAVAS